LGSFRLTVYLFFQKSDMPAITNHRDLDHRLTQRLRSIWKKGDTMARKHSDVRASGILKAAEEKMDRALLACSQEKADSELRKRLIDDLKNATNEFLELREELCQRITRDGAQTVLEELVFCDCDQSMDCTIEHWKICKRRIQKDAEGHGSQLLR
jgi:hypothetical protein